MGKTNKTFVEEKKKELESPSHKKRREQQYKLKDMVRHHDVNEEDDAFETFEPVRRKRGAV